MAQSVTVTPRARGVVEITWSALGVDDVGKWQELPWAYGGSIHAYGTLGAATFEMQGSNEDVPTAGAIVGFGAPVTPLVLPVFFSLPEWPRWVRPKTTGGAGTAITVTIIVRALSQLQPF